MLERKDDDLSGREQCTGSFYHYRGDRYGETPADRARQAGIKNASRPEKLKWSILSFITLPFLQTLKKHTPRL